MSPLAAFAWGVAAGASSTGFGVLVSANAAADFLNRRDGRATEGTGE